MALAKLCDRCGKGFRVKTSSSVVNGIAFVHFDQYSQIQNTLTGIELCPKCVKLVEEAVKPTFNDEELSNEEEM